MNFIQYLKNLKYVLENISSVISLKREKEAANLLIKNSLTASAAESCTGGLISSRLTDVSGSSAYIKKNFITYSEEAKEQLLGVKKETIEKYGVVSSETAMEMAQGLIRKYNSDTALSITGIAGPLGAEENKPIGLAYIGIADKNNVRVYKYQAPSFLTRRIMKYDFSNTALDYFIKFLKENYK